MKEITENILLDNGFKNDSNNVFSYIEEDYAIDIFCTIPIKGRSWFCVVYTNNMCRILASVAIQTIEQFNNLMDVLEVNFKLKNYGKKQSRD